MRLPRLRIRTKFFLVLGALIPAIAAVAIVGVRELGHMEREARTLYTDNIQISHLATNLGGSLADAAQVELQLVLTNQATDRARLNAQLDLDVAPRVERNIDALRALTQAFPEERERLERIESGWRSFLRLRQQDRSDRTRADAGGRAEAAQVAGIFRQLRAQSSALIDGEQLEAAEAYGRAQAVFRHGRFLLVGIALASLIAGLGSVLWLIRDIVPRVRAYSGFAARTSAGELGQRLNPQGQDEIAELGRALDEMVARRETERSVDTAHDEFTEMLQVTESEDEAHDLLKRQLERSIAGSTAVVLNRNNSADRLEPTTALATDSELRSPMWKGTSA